MCASTAKVFSQRFLLPGFGPHSFQEIELGIFLSSCHMCNISINIYLQITVNKRKKSPTMGFLILARILMTVGKFVLLYCINDFVTKCKSSCREKLEIL